MPEGMNIVVSACIHTPRGFPFLQRIKDGLYTPVGGKLKPGETWQAGLRREVQEEIGIDLKNLVQLGWINYHSGVVLYVYSKYDDNDIKIMEPNKHKKIVYVKEEDIWNPALKLTPATVEFFNTYSYKFDELFDWYV